MQNKFEVKAGDKTYYVMRPTAEVESAARAASARVFNEAVKRGDFFRAALDKVLREQGLWDEEKEKRVVELEKKIGTLERKLAKGGIPLADAKDAAVKLRQHRFERLRLLAVRRQYDANTIEGQQENYEFDYLVSRCLVNDEGDPIFKSVEEYRKSNEDFAGEAAQIMSEIHYGLKKDWQAELPENKFLKQFGFVDDELRLVDGSGNFVSTDGRRIDELGRYLDEDGNLVDEDGNRVDENGNPIEEFAPFLDEKGKPIKIKQ